MIVFEIHDKAEKNKMLGYLFFYERSRRFFAEILSELDEWNAPFIFESHVKRGIYSIQGWRYRFDFRGLYPPPPM